MLFDHFLATVIVVGLRKPTTCNFLKNLLFNYMYPSV